MTIYFKNSNYYVDDDIYTKTILRESGFRIPLYTIKEVNEESVNDTNWEPPIIKSANKVCAFCKVGIPIAVSDSNKKFYCSVLCRNLGKK